MTSPHSRARTPGRIDPAAMDRYHNHYMPQAASCVLWLNARQFAGSVGSTVATWADWSGAGRDAANGTAGERPTVVAANNSVAVRFGGSHRLFYTANVSLTTLSCIAVFEWKGGGYGGLVVWRAASSEGFSIHNSTNSATVFALNVIHYNTAGSETASNNSDAGGSTNAREIATLVYASSAHTTYRNGHSTAIGGGAGGWGSYTSGIIGQGYAYGTFDLYELMVWSVALTEAEQLNVVADRLKFWFCPA